MLTQIQMNAGNKGVEEEHDDHHSQDSNTLDQEDFVGDSVLRRQEINEGKNRDWKNQIITSDSKLKSVSRRLSHLR